MFSLLIVNNTAAFLLEPRWESDGVDQNQGVQLIATAGPLWKNW